MEKQRRKRIPVSLKSKIILGGKNYAGVIENVSECGTCVSASLSEFALIIPGEALELKFTAAAAEIGLRCRVIWVHINKIPEGLRYKMGMELIEEPTPEYKEFLKTLYL